MFGCLLACLLICLFDCLSSVCLFHCLLDCLYACWLICLFACLPACLSVCLFVCVRVKATHRGNLGTHVVSLWLPLTRSARRTKATLRLSALRVQGHIIQVHGMTKIRRPLQIRTNPPPFSDPKKVEAGSAYEKIPTRRWNLVSGVRRVVRS